MLRDLSKLKGFKIRAQDGDAGRLDDFYFDDEHWTIRYLVVNAGDWLTGREVLVSPIAVRQPEWETKRLDVALTKQQIKDSPPIDTHKPVSRQHEALYSGYYGYPYYWGGPEPWGVASLPARLTLDQDPETDAAALQAKAGKESTNSHLRSTNEVRGYHLAASDGEIGHIVEFLIDDDTWGIRYLVVDTHNWLPGKKVLISPQWITEVSWQKSKVYVDLTRATIQNAPEWKESDVITRDYENRLYDYYDRSPYWTPTADDARSRSAGKG